MTFLLEHIEHAPKHRHIEWSELKWMRESDVNSTYDFQQKPREILFSTTDFWYAN